MSDDPRSLTDLANNTKPCAYCGSPMSANAILCPTCKSYQSAWRTVLLYIAGIAGLLGIIGSAFAYIISEIPTMYRVISWHDELKLWEFAGTPSDFALAMSNVGDGSILVAEIEAFNSRGASTNFRIGKVLQPKESYTTSPSKISIINSPNYLFVVANKSGHPNNVLFDNSYMGDPSDENNSTCFLELPTSKDANEIQRYQIHYASYGLKLVLDEIKAFVTYYRVHDGQKVKVPFPATAIFLQSIKSECKALNVSD